MTSAVEAVSLPDYPRFRGIAGVWYRHALALRRVWKVALTWFFIEPACVLLAIGLGIGNLIGELPGHGTYAQFVTPGMIVGMAMYHAIFECSWGAFQRIQAHSMQTLLTTPISIVELAAGEVLWGATRAILSTTAVGGLALLLGWIDPLALLGVLLVAVLVGIEFGAIGLCFAAAARSLSTLSLIFTVVATPLFFFSGSFFPLDTLPEALRPLVIAAPLSPGVHLARGFAEHDLELGHAYALVYLIALCGLSFPIAVHLLRRRLIH